MSAIVADYKQILPLHIDSAKDFLQRGIFVAIPFLALNKTCRYPISLAMGSLGVGRSVSQLSYERTVSQVLKTVVAVVALAGAYFGSSRAMAVTMAQEAILEAIALRNFVLTKNWNEGVQSCLKMASNLLFVALQWRGGARLAMASLSMQAAVLALASIKEFTKDRWLEGSANAALSAIRLKQTFTTYQIVKRNWEIEAAIKRVFVGELHEKWQFPSDHLPVGVEVNGVRIISWNVLNNAQMGWVTDEDSQGLKGSMITDLNVPAGEGVTQRDLKVMEMIRAMMSANHIIALQECGHPFLEALQKCLPEGWHMVKSFTVPCKDQVVMLYDSSHLTYQSHYLSGYFFSRVKSRPIQNAVFSTASTDRGDLRVIHTHIPGDPDLPARYEFANYVHRNHNQGEVTVALGDNNFERHEMIEAYQKAGFSEFSLHSPWKTNIDPTTKDSKAIDHIFVQGAPSRDLSPDEVVPQANLRGTIGLLN